MAVFFVISEDGIEMVLANARKALLTISHPKWRRDNPLLGQPHDLVSHSIGSYPHIAHATREWIPESSTCYDGRECEEMRRHVWCN